MKHSLAADPVWGARGLVASVYPEQGRLYAPREEQIEISSLVDVLISRGTAQRPVVALVEGGTGVGKTLAYMVPGCLSAARNGGRMLVATHTLALMRQLVERDGRDAMLIAEKATGKVLRMAQLRGRRNFVSPSRCLAFVEQLKKDRQPDSVILAYRTMAERADDANRNAARILARLDDAWDDVAWGVAADWLDASLLEVFEMETGIDVPKDDICLAATSIPGEDAVYRLNKQLAERADILITTHANVAVALMRRLLPGAGKGATYGLLVIDEADQWPQAAAAMAAVDVSLFSIQSTIRRTMEAVRTSDLERLKISPVGVSALASIDNLVRSAPTDPGIRVPLNAPERALSVLAELRDQLRSLVDATEQRDYLAIERGHLANATRDIGMVVSAAASNSRYWQINWETSRVQAKPSVTVTARAPGRMLKNVWRTDHDADPLASAVLLTSATLSTPGFSNAAAWQGIKTAVGIPLADTDVLQQDLCAAIHPKSFGTLRFRPAHPLAEIPSPGEKGELSTKALEYIFAVISAARNSGGRVLVPVPSYRDVDQISAGLGKEVLLHRKGMRLKALLEQYRATPDACLVSPAVWVGVDLPGLVDHVVVPRLPFPPPQDGLDTLPVWAIAAMLATLNQGIGRAFRLSSSSATFWCADPRLPPPAILLEREMTVAHPKSNGLFLAAIPERFRRAFDGDQDGQNALVDFAVRISPSGSKKKAGGRR